MTREDESPVDRLPKVGEVWRLAATEWRGPIEVVITDVWPKTVYYKHGEKDGNIAWPVFRASARFLREKPKARN